MSTSKKSKVTLADKDAATLTIELGALQEQYNGSTIEFKNSKGELRSLAYNRVDRLGRFVGDRESEKGEWESYVAICFRAQHEQKRSVAAGANIVIKAGHSMRMGTASAAVRTSKMTAAKSETVVLLAHAQKLAAGIHAIQMELGARAEAARVKAESAVVMEALMGSSPVPVKAELAVA